MRPVLPFVCALVLACGGTQVDADDAAHDDDDECGMLSCSDRLQLSLVATGGVFVGGSYLVVTEVPDDVRSCSFSLSGEAGDCNGDPPCVLDNDCDAEFGFAVMPHFVLLSVRPAAELVRVGVARDSTPLFDVTLAPEYDDYFPNGSDCEPVCQVAAAAIDVP